MNNGLSKSFSLIALSSFLTSSVALVQTSITLWYLSPSVIKPLWYCLLILSTLALAASIISPFFSLLTTSAIDTVIPAIVEYLKPKFFNLSSIIDVSVVLYLLNTWAINWPKVFWTNGVTSSILAISSGMLEPIGKKYLSGVIPSILALVPSSTYGNVSGNISLNLILPTVVTKYLSLCSSVNNLYLNELTGIAILVCRVISFLSYAIKASLGFL